MAKPSYSSGKIEVSIDVPPVIADISTAPFIQLDLVHLRHGTCEGGLDDLYRSAVYSAIVSAELISELRDSNLMVELESGHPPYYSEGFPLNTLPQNASPKWLLYSFSVQAIGLQLSYYSVLNPTQRWVVILGQNFSELQVNFNVPSGRKERIDKEGFYIDNNGGLKPPDHAKYHIYLWRRVQRERSFLRFFRRPYAECGAVVRRPQADYYQGTPAGDPLELYGRDYYHPEI